MSLGPKKLLDPNSKNRIQHADGKLPSKEGTGVTRHGLVVIPASSPEKP